MMSYISTPSPRKLFSSFSHLGSECLLHVCHFIFIRRLLKSCSFQPSFWSQSKPPRFTSELMRSHLAQNKKQQKGPTTHIHIQQDMCVVCFGKRVTK